MNLIGKALLRVRQTNFWKFLQKGIVAMEMYKRRLMLGTVIGVICFLGLIETAQAQFFGFSADAALAYSANDEALSGGTVGVIHPIPLLPNFGGTGFFFERRAEGGEGFSLATKVKVTSFNLFYNIPLTPIFNVAIGGGAGTIQTKTDIITGAGNIETVEVTSPAGEGFARLGLPLASFFEFHLGYHFISTGEVEILQDAETDVKGVKEKVDFSGGLTTLGILLAF